MKLGLLTFFTYRYLNSSLAPIMSGRRPDYEREYEEYEEDYLDYEPGYGSWMEDGNPGYRDEDELDDESEESEVENPPAIITTPVVDIRSLLCNTHGVDFSEGCEQCTAVKAVVKPDLLKQLGVPSPDDDSIPDVATWFKGVKPAKEPTLVLSKASMDYAAAVYSAGPLTPRSKFDDLVKEHLYLSLEQNEQLTKHLQFEKMFRRYEKQPRLKSLMDFKNVLIKVCKSNRIAQRPLLVAVAKLDEAFRSMRGQGIKLGLTFPAKAPSKALLGPGEVQDHLAYETANPFPLPVLVDPLAGTEGVSQANKEKIRANWEITTTALEAYQTQVKNGVLAVYNTSSDSLLNLKNLVNFYL